jgi:putative two-component system response regulator
MIDLIYRAAPLHDIGKVGIPEAILHKQVHLRPEEFAVIKAHTRLGRDAIAHAEKRLGGDVPFLRVAKEIAFCHQEKWDGSGYPQGLRGEAIPLSARLMAVADVYDALITRRVYREPVEHEEAVRLILEGRGRHFDPAVVDAFATIAPTFRAIARIHADEEDSVATRQAPLCAAAAVPSAQP